MNIAVFFSGGGTDFQSIIDGVKDGTIKAKIALAVCSNHTAYGIERAKRAGIAVREFALKDFGGDNEARDRAILAALNEYKIDLVVLAGYLGVVTSQLVNSYNKRIINVHPALLPSFGGKGMFGMNVHRAVIAAGVRESGATVHYVDEGTDTGEIIAQVKVPVLDGDTPETLAARVLEQEHILLPKTVAEVVELLKKSVVNA